MVSTLRFSRVCPQPLSLLAELRHRLVHADGSPCIAVVNALVLHVGALAITAQQQLARSPAMDIFQRLVADLGPEARYVFLNGIANQLRYPNNQTHYFSCVMLHLFGDTEDERVQEQITRARLARPAVVSTSKHVGSRRTKDVVLC